MPGVDESGSGSDTGAQRAGGTDSCDRDAGAGGGDAGGGEECGSAWLPERYAADVRRVAAEVDRRVSVSVYEERGEYHPTTLYSAAASECDSWGEVLRAAGLREDASRDELAAEVRRIADAVGGAPSVGEVAERTAFSMRAYRDVFDSWGEVLRAAGVGEGAAERRRG